MVTFNNIRASLAPELPKPEVRGLLDDVPEGQTNLLPEALTRSDLKVWFTIPAHSDPTLKKESAQLYIAKVVIHARFGATDDLGDFPG